ncbi:MAG TPA: hypothetical protein DCQ31_11255 [Bacteroidales bacterium]|nr:hypothetical protein [Bacteroidales bacterium]
MNKWILILPILLFTNCASADSIEYKKADSGLLYHFVQDKKGENCKLNDIVDVRMMIKTEFDSIIWKGPIGLKVNKPSHKGGSIEDALMMLSTGDSAIFKIDTEKFYEKTRRAEVPFNLERSKNLIFNLKIVKVKTYNEYLAEKATADSLRAANEIAELEELIHELKLPLEPDKTGLYFQELKSGSGNLPKSGNKVTVHYTGTFTNGTVFDSSVERNEPFSFILGAGEVIQGWDLALAKMKEGSKARVFIPSSLAYGKQGAGDIIPPHTTLVFEIELISISKK